MALTRLSLRRTSGMSIEAARFPKPQCSRPQFGRARACGRALFSRLHEHAASLLASGVPTILAGDFNVMPTALDVYAPERWLDDALFRPEVREAFRRLIAEGWTDAVRTLHPDQRIYTFWKYYRGAFERDAGLRIDHLLLSPSVASRLEAAGVDRGVRGAQRPSDHAPVWIGLTD